MPTPTSSADPAPDASPLDRLIDDLDGLERQTGTTLWQKAERYVAGYDELRPAYPGLTKQRLTRTINKDISSRAKERGFHVPRPSFFADARKLADTWGDIFRVNPKVCDYDNYRRISVCSLPREQKDQIRDWLETFHPRQEVLRQHIREAVDARNGIYRPDFELKVSNFWKFSSPHENGHYGGIHPEIIANLLYWFTEPGDTVLDPMAGSGVLAHTLQKYRFFREAYEADGSGPRFALMSDIAPSRDDITNADARVPLPFAAATVKLAIIDPPYLTIANEKDYANLGASLDEWLAALSLVIESTRGCLLPGGLIAIITDDVLRKGAHQPIAYRITALLAEHGFIPRATIYNHNPNFVYTMGPAMMKAARLCRLQLNGCKVIQVASAPEITACIREQHSRCEN